MRHYPSGKLFFIGIGFVFITFIIGGLLKYLHQGILRFFGFNLTSKMYFDRLREFRGINVLWESEKVFDQFYIQAYQAITTKTTDLLAIMLALAGTFFMYIVGFENFLVGWSNEYIFPSNTKSFEFTPEVIFLLLTMFLYLIWLFTGWFSGLGVLLMSIQVIANMAKHKRFVKLSLDSQKGKNSSSTNFKQPVHELETKFRTIRYSLNHFRENITTFPSFMLPLNFGILVVTFLFTSLVLYATQDIQNNQDIILISLMVTVLTIIILDLYLFIPKLSSRIT